jgi:adenylate cyclase
MEMFFQEPLGLTFREVSWTSALGGIVGGIIWGSLEIADEYLWKNKRRSFSRLVFTKTLVYILIFFIISFLASWASTGSIDWAAEYILSAISIGNFLFFVVAGLLYLFIKQMNRKFGSGVLLQYVSGKYFSPKEEERIFMFLDLKSSTTIAEKLSHVLYSKLLQDCFAELTFPVINSKARIYQYVGDEAVITWSKKDGFTNSNCIKMYFEFNRQLQKKKEYFISSYGVFPEFKAAMSYGLVTVAEVGVVKTEIAYHGDVLNTAARIQGYCSKLNQQLLVSEALAKALVPNNELAIKFFTEVQLRGKKVKSKIFSVGLK